jgi:hypothetical protein
MVFEGEYCLTLKTGLMSPANEIKDRSAETFDLRLSPVLTTVTTIPLSTRGVVEVLQNKNKKRLNPNTSGRTNTANELLTHAIIHGR